MDRQIKRCLFIADIIKDNTGLIENVFHELLLL